MVNGAAIMDPGTAASMHVNARPSGTPGIRWWTRTPPVPPMNKGRGSGQLPRGHPGNTVVGDRCPALVIDAAVNEHLEVLGFNGASADQPHPGRPLCQVHERGDLRDAGMSRGSPSVSIAVYHADSGIIVMASWTATPLCA